MTAKEYLQQIKKNDTRINRLLRECEEIRSSIVFISGIDYSRERIQSSVDGTPGPNKSIEKLYDMEKRLTRMIDKSVDDKTRIIDQINRLGREEYSELLYMRYVNYMSLEEISVSMKYSYNRIKHLHGIALQHFYNKFLKVDT